MSGTTPAKHMEKLRILGGGSSESDTTHDTAHTARLELPSLPKFTGDDCDDNDLLRRWLKKLEKHAKLRSWTEREKLVQFELHLARRAEQLYEVLPSKAKES